MNSKLAIVVALVITISVGFGIYYVTLPSAPTSKVPKRLKIVRDTSYINEVDNVTFFVVVGIVQNNLSINVESVNITVTFFDSANKRIGTAFSRSQLRIIKAGVTAPFEEVTLLYGSSGDVPDRYEFSVLGFETNEEPIDGLEIVKQISSFDADGYHKINGEVQNTGNRRAYSVKVICSYYDSGDNLLATSWTGVSSAINRGQKRAFELSTRPQKIVPARYELFVVALRYESLVIANYVFLGILIGVFTLFIAYMKHRGW